MHCASSAYHVLWVVFAGRYRWSRQAAAAQSRSSDAGTTLFVPEFASYVREINV